MLTLTLQVEHRLSCVCCSNVNIAVRKNRRQSITFCLCRAHTLTKRHRFANYSCAELYFLFHSFWRRTNSTFNFRSLTWPSSRFTAFGDVIIFFSSASHQNIFKRDSRRKCSLKYATRRVMFVFVAFKCSRPLNGFALYSHTSKFISWQSNQQ